MAGFEKLQTGYSRRRFLLTGAAMSLVLGCQKGAQPMAAKPPNILYITADDLGTRLGAYGHDVHTPNIDRLAKQGVLFEECHCQSAICGGSRTSILTGLRPETSGVDSNHDPWRGNRLDSVTLPRHFKDNGYKTYALGKIEHRQNGDLDDPWTYRQRGALNEKSLLGFLDRVSENLEAAPEQTFFTAIGFKQPHCPWTSGDAFLKLYPPKRVWPEIGPGRETSAGFINRCLRGAWDEGVSGDTVTLTDLQALHIGQNYLAEISELDHMVGLTLEAAKNHGLLENTIIIFWSGDHGYALGDSNQWGKWVPKQTVSRIPLIVEFPDERFAGSRVTGLVEAVDMYPTLLEICDLPEPPQPLDGLSWVPHLKDPNRPGKDVVFTRFDRQSGVSDGRWNYIRDFSDNTEQLFDRLTDPQEMTDVSLEYPQHKARLSKALDDLPTVLKFEDGLRVRPKQEP